MVKVICGMIGSGKTTYALNNKKPDDILLDWDILDEAFRTNNSVWVKGAQDILLEYFNNKNQNIWYITTMLGSDEKEILARIKEVEYIWINTTKRQCLKNIKARNRNNEANNIDELVKANERIYNSYCNNSDIRYKVIEVFDSEERW